MQHETTLATLIVPDGTESHVVEDVLKVIEKASKSMDFAEIRQPNREGKAMRVVVRVELVEVDVPEYEGT